MGILYRTRHAMGDLSDAAVFESTVMCICPLKSEDKDHERNDVKVDARNGMQIFQWNHLPDDP